MNELEFLKRSNKRKKLTTSMTDDIVWRYLNLNYKRKWGAYLKENDLDFSSMNIFKRGIKRIL